MGQEQHAPCQALSRWKCLRIRLFLLAPGLILQRLSSVSLIFFFSPLEGGLRAPLGPATCLSVPDPSQVVPNVNQSPSAAPGGVAGAPHPVGRPWEGELLYLLFGGSAERGFGFLMGFCLFSLDNKRPFPHRRWGSGLCRTTRGGLQGDGGRSFSAYRGALKGVVFCMTAKLRGCSCFWGAAVSRGCSAPRHAPPQRHGMMLCSDAAVSSPAMLILLHNW